MRYVRYRLDTNKIVSSRLLCQLAGKSGNSLESIKENAFVLIIPTNFYRYEGITYLSRWYEDEHHRPTKTKKDCFLSTPKSVMPC